MAASHPSFDLGIEEAAKELSLLNVKVGETEGVGLQIVEPCNRGFLDLDLNRNPFDLNKFPDEGLDFGFQNEELNKEVHNMLKIFVDSTY
ncbi:hypothetical protein TSUD_376660 [Trifolium subterraneum]|uniref:Uncharacterized protein n=1 Tax=Trifolium subterraneum TaxID=3900 RepID=A0A2Z6NY55_TRISU|nr:hypothetical protein TSUD_376660 [Trifolium subterraneum]